MKGVLVENYRKSFEFMRECRWFFVGALGLFTLTFLIGFAFPVFFREEIIAMLKELVLSIEGLGMFELAWFIFLNNLAAGFMAFVLGIGLGVFPLVTCVVNGYLLGLVAREAVMVEGIWTLWRILPHGVFELPAVLFSIGMGLKLGGSIFSFKKGEVERSFVEGLRVFVFVIFPLLIVAAIVEGILIGLV